MKKKFYGQQGDVIIEEIESIEDGLEVSMNGSLQFGEMTGHCHRLMGGMIMFRKTDLDSNGNGLKYFKLDAPTQLKHEEHNPITIPAGLYRSRIVREYSHFDEEARNVAD